MIVAIHFPKSPLHFPDVIRYAYLVAEKNRKKSQVKNYIDVNVFPERNGNHLLLSFSTSFNRLGSTPPGSLSKASSVGARTVILSPAKYIYRK